MPFVKVPGPQECLFTYNGVVMRALCERRGPVWVVLIPFVNLPEEGKEQIRQQNMEELRFARLHGVHYFPDFPEMIVYVDAENCDGILHILSDEVMHV